MKIMTSAVALYTTLVIFELVACSSAFSGRSPLDLHALDFLQLKAATRTVDVAKRSDDFILTNASTFVYVDGRICTHSLILNATANCIILGDYLSQQSSFVSSIFVESTNPILPLEDIEHHLERIECSSSNIDLHFARRDLFSNAKYVYANLVGGHVVTSGCSEAGERVPYL
jgi:hypothetical protein